MVDIIKKNYAEILDDVNKYSPHKDRVKVVAASKYVDYKGILDLGAAGVEVCGENRVQALRDKRDELAKDGKEDIVTWHFIGTLQKNKIKYIIDYIDLVQSVDSLSLLKELDKKAKQKDRVLDVLVEINISNEESKHGFTPHEFVSIIDEVKILKNIKVKGFMTMAPFTADEGVVREVFRGLRLFRDEVNKKYFDGELDELSMGMSNDYKIALEEGATIIRIGSKLFEDRR